MALSGQKIITFANNKWSLKFEWALVSQSITDGTSTFDWWLTLHKPNEFENQYSFIRDNDAKTTWSVKLGNSKNNILRQYSGGGNLGIYNYNDSNMLLGGTDTLPATYTAEDSSSFQFELFADIQLTPSPTALFAYQQSSQSSLQTQLTNVSTVQGSSSYSLPSLSRIPTISVPSTMTDEDNLVITVDNPLGTANSTFYCDMELYRATGGAVARRLTKTNTGGNTITHTWSTDELKDMYYSIKPGATTNTLHITLYAVYDGHEYASNTVTTAITVINPEPTINPRIYDINPVTVALTKGGSYTSSDILVANASTPNFTLYAHVEKGASSTKLVDYGITNGTYSFKNTQDGTFPTTQSNVFKIWAEDNRGFRTESEPYFTINDGHYIEYFAPTCTISKTTLMTGDGDVTVTIKGKYWNGNFGAADNKLYLTYHHATSEDDGVFTSSEEFVINPTMSNETEYTYTFTISGLDYTKSHRVYVTIRDEIKRAVSNMTTVSSSMPLFDWGKDDFQFNIPVEFNAGYNAPQTVLWSGALHMNANQSVDLTGKEISKQSNGILLVFSLYRNDAAEDVSIHSFFISKKMVELFSSGKYPFWMTINNNLSIVGCKYLTITNSKITGDASNTSSGTANGSSITFNNSNFVLRYVIGV